MMSMTILKMQLSNDNSDKRLIKLLQLNLMGRKKTISNQNIKPEVDNVRESLETESRCMSLLDNTLAIKRNSTPAD